MTRYVLFVLFALALTVNLAFAASGGRSLPESEAPLIVQKIFTTPVGEVQFVGNQSKNSVFLRTKEGVVCEVERIEGEPACQNFADSKGAAADIRCIFSFEKGGAACQHRIFTYEFQESDLFRVVRSITTSQLEGDPRAN